MSGPAFGASWCFRRRRRAGVLPLTGVRFSGGRLPRVKGAARRLRRWRCAPPWTWGGRESPGPWSPNRFRGKWARGDGGRRPGVGWPGAVARRMAPMASAFDFRIPLVPRMPGGGHWAGGTGGALRAPRLRRRSAPAALGRPAGGELLLSGRVPSNRLVFDGFRATPTMGGRGWVSAVSFAMSMGPPAEGCCQGDGTTPVAS